MIATVYRYGDGERLGDAEVDWDAYLAECQEPEGLIPASGVLGDADIERLGVDGRTTVYLLMRRAYAKLLDTQEATDA